MAVFCFWEPPNHPPPSLLHLSWNHLLFSLTFPPPTFFHYFSKFGGSLDANTPFFGFPTNSNLKPATIFQKMGEELKERLSKLIKLSITPTSPPPHSPSENFLELVAHAQNVTSHKMLRHTHTHQRPRGSVVERRGGGGAPQWSRHTA